MLPLTSKKLSKSTFFKSMGESIKREEKMNTEISKDNNKPSISEERKSSDISSTIINQNMHKSSNIKDEIKGLLKRLVQENKKKIEIEKSKDLPLTGDNKMFITMKDIQIAEDV